MPDTIRQQIIDAIDARFKGILISGGYGTDLGSNVFAWRRSALEESELDALTYRDAVEGTIDSAGEIEEKNLIINIEIFSTSPAQLRKCLADLEKAVNVDFSWGNLAILTSLKTNEMEVEQKDQVFAASGIAMEVDYLTVRGDPYTKGY